MQKKPKTLNYYFLNKYIHPKAPAGYRENIAALIINQNSKEEVKYLLVQEKNDAWTLPKKAVTGDNLLEGVLNALVKDIGDELGFKGVVINEKNPQFVQKAILFNFGKQRYDKIRSEYEAGRGRPSKGKLYHLVVVHYNGPDDLPLKDDPTVTTKDFRWANDREVVQLTKSNLDLVSKDPNFSSKSAEYNMHFSDKAITTYALLKKITDDKEGGQLTLIH